MTRPDLPSGSAATVTTTGYINHNERSPRHGGGAAGGPGMAYGEAGKQKTRRKAGA
jgi:hypothetical protein